MHAPLVSVVMPVYNASSTVGEAVASVQAQGVSDLEIVVVDDGSTDDTAAVVEALAARDGRIRLVRQENAGCPAARGAGFVQSRGRFLTTLDGDDLFAAHKLRQQLAVLRRHPEAIVLGGIRRFCDRDGSRVWLRETMPFVRENRRAYLERVLAARNDEMSLMNTFCAKREHLLEDNYDPSIATAHDWEVWLRLAAKHRFISLPRAHYYYRKHDASATRNRPHRLTIDCQFDVLRRHLAASGLPRRRRRRVFCLQAERIARRYADRGDALTAWYCLGKAAAVPAAYGRPEFYRLLLRTAGRSLRQFGRVSA